MNYNGVIIEESLSNKSVLDKVKIVKTRVEQVTAKHKTPWLRQWTLHAVEINASDADNVAELISNSIDNEHNSWYADFKNDKCHYIIFHEKVFKISRGNSYRDARAFGLSLGIPQYQMSFERLKR